MAKDACDSCMLLDRHVLADLDGGEHGPAVVLGLSELFNGNQLVHCARFDASGERMVEAVFEAR